VEERKVKSIILQNRIQKLKKSSGLVKQEKRWRIAMIINLVSVVKE